MKICAMKTGFYIAIGLLILIEDVILRVYTLCPLGFHGYRCQESCKYPKFGLRCERVCDCRQGLCNHIKGCPPPDAVCPAGFTGKYCDDQCKHPNYGYGCQQQCFCPKVRCSTVTGCPKRKPDNIHPYLKTKSSSAPKEKTTIKGITEIQSEPLVNNNSKITEGFTLEIQINSQRENESIQVKTEISEEAVNEQIENTLFTQPSQTSKVTWIHIAIISVGGMVAVMVIAHVVLSIFHCANVNHRPRHP